MGRNVVPNNRLLAAKPARSRAISNLYAIRKLYYRDSSVDFKFVGWAFPSSSRKSDTLHIHTSIFFIPPSTQDA